MASITGARHHFKPPVTSRPLVQDVDDCSLMFSFEVSMSMQAATYDLNQYDGNKTSGNFP